MAGKKTQKTDDAMTIEGQADSQQSEEIGTGEEVERLLAEVAALKKQNDELSAKLAAMSGATLEAEDGVVWGGQRCNVIYAGETRQLWEDFKKRNVPDGWMALVIDYPA